MKASPDYKVTAVYPNRQQDKLKVENCYSALKELGNDTTRFYMFDSSNQELILFAVGYTRVVYGDHGPYVEFAEHHLRTNVYESFAKSAKPFNPTVYQNTEKKWYYVWCNIINQGHGNSLPYKIYYQLRTVADLPNAPPREDGLPSRFNRSEGYADYLRYHFYVSPYCFEVIE